MSYEAVGTFSRYLASRIPSRHDLVDGATPREGILREVIVGAGQQCLAGADGLRERDHPAGASGERFSDGKRLREEALDLARARQQGQIVGIKVSHLSVGRALQQIPLPAQQ